MPEVQIAETLESTLSERFQDNPEFHRCLLYLKLRDPILSNGQKHTHVSIAQEFGIHENTLRNWIAKWTQSGLLDELRSALMVLRQEELEVVATEIIEHWPAILLNIANLAEHGKGRTAIEAAMFLKAAVVDPTITGSKGSGSHEMDYLKNPRSFDPMAV